MNNNQGALYFGAGIDMTQWRQNVNEMRRDILGLSQNTAQQTKQMDSAAIVSCRFLHRNIKLLDY